MALIGASAAGLATASAPVLRCDGLAKRLVEAIDGPGASQKLARVDPQTRLMPFSLHHLLREVPLLATEFDLTFFDRPRRPWWEWDEDRSTEAD